MGLTFTAECGASAGVPRRRAATVGGTPFGSRRDVQMTWHDEPCRNVPSDHGHRCLRPDSRGCRLGMCRTLATMGRSLDDGRTARHLGSGPFRSYCNRRRPDWRDLGCCRQRGCGWRRGRCPELSGWHGRHRLRRPRGHARYLCAVSGSTTRRTRVEVSVKADAALEPRPPLTRLFMQR
jgi:hypothetical protein